jgi:hypothetical protein
MPIPGSPMRWRDTSEGFVAVRKSPVHTKKGNLVWLGGTYRVTSGEDRRWTATFRDHGLGGMWHSSKAAMADINRYEARRRRP